MLKIVGFHEHLSDGSNEIKRIPIDSKFKFSLDLASLLSFSVYSNHAVWITKDGQGFGVGDNRGLSIIGTLPEKEFVNASPFVFSDSEGNSCKLLSAVCGSCYTLYLVQPSTSSGKSRLAYVAWNKNKGMPLFLNLSGRDPVALFGGRETAAAINTDGSIIVITEKASDSLDESVIFTKLPGKEKASCVACCHKFIYVLSLTGHVYQCPFTIDEKIESEFVPVENLIGIKCTQISGTWDHCLAVAEDGRVFAVGANVSGQMGLKREIIQVDHFILMESLSEYKIKMAFAGYFHSLFITDEGKVLACGRNTFGQLLLETGATEKPILYPVETSIKSGATFAIAGPGVSAVFIGANPPSNMPNVPIVDFCHQATDSDENIFNSLSNHDFELENANLKSELSQIKKEKETLLAELDSLKKKLKETQDSEATLKQKVWELENKIGK